MITNRRYTSIEDYYAISDFLISLYQPLNKDGNWIQPIWAYMHSHPNLDFGLLGRIRLWHDDDRLVAVAHYEYTVGEAFLPVHPDYAHLKAELLDYAIAELARVDADGTRTLRVYLPDVDPEFEAIARARGFELEAEGLRTMSYLETPEGFAPDLRLSSGYRIVSLAEENDLVRMHRVLWRGFNHQGEPPAEGILWRRQMQSSPFFRHDLTLAVVAPNGDWASFCGMWYEPHNRIALVEPVATDPTYRRLGLGRAVVLEGIRRCADLGARIAYVGSDQLFYKSIGFKETMAQRPWLLRETADSRPRPLEAVD